MVDATEGQVDQLLPEGMAGQEKVECRLVHAVAEIGEVLRRVGKEVGELLFLEVELFEAVFTAFRVRRKAIGIHIETLVTDVLSGRGECGFQFSLGEEHAGNRILVLVPFLVCELVGRGIVVVPSAEQAPAVVGPV